jgi:RNA methyltransferase, TrmH family
MEETVIQSAQNAKLKLLRAMRSGKERDLVLLEGARVLADALSAGVKPRWVLFDPDLKLAVAQRTLEMAREAEIPCLPCEPKLMAADGDLVTSVQILGCAVRPTLDVDALFADAAAANGLIVVSAGVQDPGNGGALVRCAAGLGAHAILFLQGGVSPWHPRAIRGASGTTFRMPVADGLNVNQFVELCRKHKVDLWATSAEGELMGEVKRSRAAALVLGEEGGGMPKRLMMECDRQIGIPLQREVESLNVATAAALLIHALV